LSDYCLCGSSSEVLEWAPGADAPRVVASSATSNSSNELRLHRAAFSRASAALAAGRAQQILLATSSSQRTCGSHLWLALVALVARHVV